MKKVLSAALLLAASLSLAGPALAQKGNPQPPSKPEQEKLRPGEEPRPVVDEKKYKSAVDSMGNREAPKVDPWAGVRDKK